MQKRRIIKQKILKFVSGHKLSIIILATLLLLFIVPPFINWVVSTDLGLGIGFITPENKDTWIGFYGAIIGGGITLGGVWWTLKKQEDIRMEDLYNHYFPQFDISLQDKSNVYKLSPTLLLKPNNKKFSNELTDLNQSIKFTNLGKTAIQDIEYEVNGILFSSKILNINYDNNILYHEIDNSGCDNLVPITSSFFLNIKLPKLYLDYKNITIGENIFSINVSLSILIPISYTEDDKYEYFLSFEINAYSLGNTYELKIENILSTR